MPAFATAPAVHDVTLKVVLSLGGLSLLCSCVAYLLYYRLVNDIGPTRALTFNLPSEPRLSSTG